MLTFNSEKLKTEFSIQRGVFSKSMSKIYCEIENVDTI